MYWCSLSWRQRRGEHAPGRRQERAGAPGQHGGRIWPPEQIRFDIHHKPKGWKSRGWGGQQKFIGALKRILKPSSIIKRAVSAGSGTAGTGARSAPRCKQLVIKPSAFPAPAPRPAPFSVYSRQNPCPLPTPRWLFVTGVGTYSRGASQTCLTEKRPDGCQINSAPLLFAALTHYAWKAAASPCKQSPGLFNSLQGALHLHNNYQQRATLAAFVSFLSTFNKTQRGGTNSPVGRATHPQLSEAMAERPRSAHLGLQNYSLASVPPHQGAGQATPCPQHPLPPHLPTRRQSSPFLLCKQLTQLLELDDYNSAAQS